MRLGLLIVLVFSVIGCTTPSPYSPVSTASPSQAASSVVSCTYVTEHLSIDGAHISSGYVCTLLPSSLTSASSGNLKGTVSQTKDEPQSSSSTVHLPSDCTFVSAYTKKDGTTIPSHVRCKTYSSALSYRNSSLPFRPNTEITNSSPCVTSSCGPVSVKGYYRKDGTYVRPHTRRR